MCASGAGQECEEGCKCAEGVAHPAKPEEQKHTTLIEFKDNICAITIDLQKAGQALSHGVLVMAGKHLDAWFFQQAQKQTPQIVKPSIGERFKPSWFRK